jgi:transcription initiation factor TFIID TATA-box-binding protein
MKIINVVAVATLNHTLDLPLIHTRLTGSSFPEKSHWLRMRLEDNTYIAFYKSGKFLVTQKKPDALAKIADDVIRKLKEIGVNVEIKELIIHNIVVMDSVTLNISLENLIANLDPKKASYEPEQFPALLYKDWGVSFLLFSSGKMIVTGAKTLERAEEGINNFKRMISSYRWKTD